MNKFKLKISLTQFFISVCFVLIVFEGFIATRIGNFYVMYFFKNIPDLIIIGLFLRIFKVNMFRDRGFLFLTLFVLYAMVLCFLNEDPLIAVLNLKSFIRYSLCFYVIYHSISFSIVKFGNLYLALIIIQSIIALIQLFVFDGFARPLSVQYFDEKEVVGSYSVGVSGTFENTISFAYFFIGYAALYRTNIISKTAGLFLTYNSMAIVPFMAHLITLLKKHVFKFLALLTPLMIFLILNTNNTSNQFLILFTYDFWEIILEKQRGAILLSVIAPLYLKPKIIFGYGPSLSDDLYFYVRDYIGEFLFELSEDVYLLLIPIYFGFIGTFIFYKFLKHYLKNIKKSNRLLLIFLFLFLNLFNQAIETKIFGFIFYFMMAIFLKQNENTGSKQPL